MYDCFDPRPSTDYHRQVTLTRPAENGGKVQTVSWVKEDLAVEGKHVRFHSHDTYEGEWPDKRKIEHFHSEIWTVESVSDTRMTPDQFRHHIPHRPRKRKRQSR